MDLKTHKKIDRALNYLIAICFTVLIVRCTLVPVAPPSSLDTSQPIATQPVSAPASSPTSSPSPTKISYSWEKNHPERADWSDALTGYLSLNFDSFIKAKDSNFFCSKFSSLNASQQIQVWGEMIVWTAYYESAWDPTDYSVDVGTKDDNGTWSVGLLQMSVVDQESYGFPFGYSFTDLQKPSPNLRLGVSIMAQQIVRYGVIMIPVGGKGLYWATLHPGGKYDSSNDIASHVKSALSFCQ